MTLPSIYQLSNLYRKTLSAADYRIIDHGERVAYILHHMLQHFGGKYTDMRLPIHIVACLHDIGAYKTDRLSNLADFNEIIHYEIQNCAPHSVYSYEFLKRFLPELPYLDAALYHHLPYKALLGTPCRSIEISALLAVADRVDLFFQLGQANQIYDNLRGYRGTVFSADAVDLFFEANESDHMLQNLSSGAYFQELTQYMDGLTLSDTTSDALLRMLTGFIDYRSEATAAHTLLTVAIADELSARMGLSQTECDLVHYGSMLHDIGKIATPINILEKTDRLTAYEFNVMKDHVRLTENLLQGCVEPMLTNVASRHHEKLDGSGYPHGLDAAALTTADRLVAIADVASALLGKRSYKKAMDNETVCRIMREEAAQGRLCPVCVALFCDHVADIVLCVEQKSEQAAKEYAQMSTEYIQRLHALRAYASS